MSKEQIQTINAEKPYMRWLMLFFVCLAFFLINGFVYQSFNVLVQTVTVDLQWTAVERALVVSGYSSGMIWFIFVAGITLDKFSVRRVLSVFLVLAAVLVFLRGQITGAFPFFVLMFLYGASVGFIIPSLNKINGLWFDQKGIFLANGFLTASSPLGQITGNMLSVPIMNALGGWRQLFTLQAILLIAVALLIFFFAKDRRNIDAALASDKIKSEDDLGLWKNIKAVVKVPQFWLYTIANCGLLGMIYAGGAQGQIILQTDPNWMLPKNISGIVPSFNNFSSMVCYILIPLIINKYFKTNYEKNYKIIVIITGIVSSVCYWIGYRSYNLTLLCVLMIFAGASFGACVPAPKVSMLKLPDISGARAGTGIGVYMTFERLATTLMTGAIGGFIALYPQNSAEILSNFWLIMLVSPLMFTISLFMDKRNEKKAAQAAAAGE